MRNVPTTSQNSDSIPLMRFRKPEIIPVLFIITATFLLFGLGIWQLQRLEWKTDLLAKIEHTSEMEALGNLPSDLSDDYLYRHVMLTGRFLHDQKFLLAGSKQHEGPGFYVLTPFVLEDDGRVILINRGFSPEDKETRPEGIITIEGTIRPPRQKRLFMPTNREKRNVWFYEDLPLMEKRVGEALLPYIVEITGEKQAGIYPIPSDGKVIMRNDHLHYAFTWFSIGIIGLIMFAFYHRIPESRKKELENPHNNQEL